MFRMVSNGKYYEPESTRSIAQITDEEIDLINSILNINIRSYEFIIKTTHETINDSLSATAELTKKAQQLKDPDQNNTLPEGFEFTENHHRELIETGKQTIKICISIQNKIQANENGQNLIKDIEQNEYELFIRMIQEMCSICYAATNAEDSELIDLSKQVFHLKETGDCKEYVKLVDNSKKTGFIFTAEEYDGYKSMKAPEKYEYFKELCNAYMQKLYKMLEVINAPYEDIIN